MRSLRMIDKIALKHGLLTYEEIVMEGKQLVDAMGDLATAVKSYHEEKVEEFVSDVGFDEIILFELGLQPRRSEDNENP
jgi:hypothetical protein